MQAPSVNESFQPSSQARTAHLPGVPVEEARARLRRALAVEGFSMMADVDLADLLNRRLDERIEPYFVIEACHPLLAQQAMAVAREGGLLMPTTLCLWKEGNGSTVVTLPPARLAQAIGLAHLDPVAGGISERLERVFAHLDEPATVASAEIAAAGPLELTESERITLLEAARRHIHELLEEVAGTESRPLQHELARTINQLECIAGKLEAATGSSHESH
jgi:uncharacterized protein (DUF302 family)